MEQKIKDELMSIMAISERYTDCDACALINERVSKLLEDLKDS